MVLSSEAEDILRFIQKRFEQMIERLEKNLQRTTTSLADPKSEEVIHLSSVETSEQMVGSQPHEAFAGSLRLSPANPKAKQHPSAQAYRFKQGYHEARKIRSRKKILEVPAIMVTISDHGVPKDQGMTLRKVAGKTLEGILSRATQMASQNLICKRIQNKRSYHKVRKKNPKSKTKVKSQTKSRCEGEETKQPGFTILLLDSCLDDVPSLVYEIFIERKPPLEHGRASRIWERGRIDSLHSEGVHRLLKRCCFAVTHLPNLGKPIISHANKVQDDYADALKIKWPENHVDKAKLIRGKTKSLDGYIEAVSNSFITEASKDWEIRSVRNKGAHHPP